MTGPHPQPVQPHQHDDPDALAIAYDALDVIDEINNLPPRLQIGIIARRKDSALCRLSWALDRLFGVLIVGEVDDE